MDNPYNEPQVNIPDSAKDLFGKYRLLKRRGVGGGQQGELLRYFCEKLNPSRIHQGYAPLTEKALVNILYPMTTVRDLFWLKSVCEDIEERNGGSAFSKRFWWVVKQKSRVDDLPEEFINSLELDT